MQARMRQPAMIVPGAMEAILALGQSARKSDVPAAMFKLIDLRASQINGCSFCVDMHSREMKEAGESDERIWGVAGWRDSAYFTEAERAVLALTEAVTRLADRPDDAVSDALWEEVNRHFGEREIAGLLLGIATINVWNRLNVPTHQPPARRE